MEEQAKETKISVRDQVLAMLKEGKFTREQIANTLGTSVASVSSQFTYLRWMGNFIVSDEDKTMKLVTKEEYDAIQAAKTANKKSKAVKTSAKTPVEQYVAITKQISTLEKQSHVWTAKLNQVDKDLKAAPDDLELQEMQAEAAANVTLKRIALRKAQSRLAAIPKPSDEELAALEAEEAEVEAEAEAEEPMDEEDDNVSDDLV